MEFSFKDLYRQSVEFCSDGRNTVMYDEYDNPNVMVCIRKYDMEILGLSPGTHPAFIVNDREVPEIWVSKYQNTVGNGGVPVSLPNAIQTTMTAKSCKTTCRKKGKGWHQLTNFEYSAMALLNYVRNGNTCIRAAMYDGSASIDGIADTPDDRHFVPAALTSCQYGENVVADGAYRSGTGPWVYATNDDPYGVHDLIGNYREVADGIRINSDDGCIEVWGKTKGEYHNDFVEDTYIRTPYAIEWWGNVFWFDDNMDPGHSSNIGFEAPFAELQIPDGNEKYSFMKDLTIPKAMMIYPIDTAIESYKSKYMIHPSNYWFARYGAKGEKYVFLRGGSMNNVGYKIQEAGLFAINSKYTDTTSLLVAPRSVYIDIP